MKIKLSAGTAFQIEPGKKYVLIIAPKVELPEEQKNEIKNRMAPILENVALEFLPPGTKYKLVELPNDANVGVAK